jgi:hypothetical protein
MTKMEGPAILSPAAADELRSTIYRLRLEAFQLENQLFDADNLERAEALAAALNAKAGDMTRTQAQLQASHAANADAARVIKYPPALPQDRQSVRDGVLVSVDVFLRMSAVPTSICHLLRPSDDPLLTFSIATSDLKLRRLVVKSFVEGFSTTTATTVHVRRNAPAPNVCQLPTFFHGKIQELHEITRGSLNVIVEDLDLGTTLLHETVPIWLLPPTSAPLAVQDPRTGQWHDMTRYLGAFVTPHEPSVMEFISKIKQEYPSVGFTGYQGSPGSIDRQVNTLFDSFKNVGKLNYVNSMLDMNPDTGVQSQYLRLPRQVIQHKTANCIDGALLFASLLEAISLSPALVILPAHALVAWETQSGSNVWQYLDTTKIPATNYNDARDFSTRIAKQLESAAEATGIQAYFRRWPLRELRTKYGIWPME